jgi:HemY protein
MRRGLFWWLLMFLLLVSVVWLASNNEGYVLIVRSPYRLQFSFNFLLILIVIGFLGVHYCLRFVHFLRRLPASKRSKREAQWLKAGNEALLEAMNALVEGDSKKAEVAAKRAHELIKHADLERLIETLAAEKNKQETLFK